jgi:methionine-rich copper-binding protein CopC
LLACDSGSDNEETFMKTSQLILIAIAGAAAQLAFAHAELSDSSPADRAMVESAPENVTLQFSEPVRLTALAIQKDGDQKRNLGPLSAETSETFAVAVPTLEDGHYTVTWRALSDDTHVMTGEFMFMVGATGDHDQPMNHTANTDSAATHSEHDATHTGNH